MKGLIFTYVMTYGGAVAAIFNPFIGLLIYVGFSILMPDELWADSVPRGNYSRVVAVGMLGGWLMGGLGNWKLGQARTVVFLLFGLWVWTAVSAFLAPNQEVGWGFVEKVSKTYLPFLVGITTLNSVNRLKQLAWTIIICEGYLALEFNISYFQGYNRLWMQGFGPMDNNCNAIALVTCTGLSLGAGLYENRWWSSAIGFASTFLLTHAILFSFSRGGMLGLGTMGLATFILMPKRPKFCLAACFSILMVAVLAGPKVVERFTSSFADEQGHMESSAQSRLDLWRNCIDVMRKNPVFGAGPEHWPLLANSYGWPEGKEAHTLWLAIGAELGVPGLALLASFYLVCMCRLWRLIRAEDELEDPWLAHGGRMVIASLCGFAVSAQFVSIRTLEHPYYIMLLGAGILKLSLPHHYDGLFLDEPDFDYQHHPA